MVDEVDGPTCRRCEPYVPGKVVLWLGGAGLRIPRIPERGRSGVCQLPWYIGLVEQDTAARALLEETREVYTC